jgi:hypothetical protein
MAKGYKPEVLTRPLAPEEIEWRVASAKNGWTTVVPYINARTVMERFDEAFGPLNWQVEYREFTVGSERGVLAAIKVRDPETGEWITKADGAEPSQTEPFKGGLSGALKRAAVPWGIGRELHRYPTVQIQGEHKYVPFRVMDTLARLVEALAKGRPVPDLVRLTPDGQKALRAA